MKRFAFALLAIAFGYTLVGWPWHTLAVLGFVVGALGLAAQSFTAGGETQKALERERRAATKPTVRLALDSSEFQRSLSQAQARMETALQHVVAAFPPSADPGKGN